MNEMPEITYKGTTKEEEEILKRICVKGHLRASSPMKPNLEEVKHGEGILYYHFKYSSEEDRLRGRSAYVWRMVAFLVSPHAPHHCMPVRAEFYLASYRVEKSELDSLIDRIVNAVPKEQWSGVIRWGRALGNS